MATLFGLIERAGLVPVEAGRVVLPNFRFPVLTGTDFDSAPIENPLFCNEAPVELPQATLLYFTLPGCENCRPGLLSFQKLAGKSSVELKAKVCFRVVVSDWQTQAEISQELRELSWQGRVGVVWDEKGVLQERLAVLGQPAFFVLNRDGQVAAYRNGPVEFASPGFDVFWTEFAHMIKNDAIIKGSASSWNSKMSEEIPTKSSSTVMFLNNGALSLAWLVAAIALCYSLTRFFLRLRKNFKGS
jgi:hypothetical protein